MTSDPVYCQECGAELPPGAKFCAECGEPLASDGADATASTAGTGAAPDDESTADDSAAADPDTDQQAAAQGPSARGSDATTGQQAAAQESEGSLAGRTVLNSLIGSVVGFVGAVVLVLSTGPLYFVGVMFGSGVAGWLQGRGAGSGALVGGVAGFAATLLFAPFAVILIVLGLGQFILTGAQTGFMSGMSTELPESQSLLTALVGIGAVVLVIAIIINLIIGAISGAVGGAIAD